jgi:hypothetical protein
VELNGLHGVIFQKMILFITTSVKTSNPTKLIEFYIDGQNSPALVKILPVCGLL